MKTIKAYLVAALVAVGLNFVAQATVMRAELSLASLSEDARLKPIAVKLAPNSPVGFSYADCTPEHMAFIGADGKELPFEVATWNTSGESVIWVRPLTTDDTITLTYGAEVTPTKAATEVWAEYSGVWHFDQFDPDATTRSQASSPNSTAEGDIDAHIADKTGTLTNQEGRFGTGVQTADASSNGGGLWMKDPGDDSPLDGGAYFTISGWFKHHDADCSWDHIFYKRSRENNATDGSNPYNGGFAIEVATAGPTYPLTTQGNNGGWPHFDTTINARGKWVYLTFVYDGAKCTTYADGKSVLETKTDFGAASNNNAPLAVGNNSNFEFNGGVDSPWRGFVDEVRFSKGVKSVEWIEAEYECAAGDILSMGEVQTIVSEELVTVTITADDSKETYTATANDELVTSGGAVSSNAMVTVVATPKTDYLYFPVPEGWTKGTEEKTITAKFRAENDPTVIEIPDPTAIADIRVKVTVEPPQHGTITGAKDEYEYGVQATLTAEPEDGFVFAGWTGAAEGETANPLTLTMDDNKTIGAIFKPINLIKNGSFEEGIGDSIPVGGVQNPLLSLPTGMTGGDDILAVRGKGDRSGDGAVIPASIKIYDGYYTVGFARKGWYSMNVEVARPGLYELTVHKIARSGYTGGTIDVYCDDDKCTTISAAGTSAWETETKTFKLSMGTHALKFQHVSSGDKQTLLDDLSLCLVEEDPKHTVNFVNTESQTYTATVLGNEVKDGDQVYENSIVTVTATPAEGYGYGTAPEGWRESGASITKDFTIVADTAITIPEAQPLADVKYMLTLAPCTWGSIVGKSGEFSAGETTELTAIPEDDGFYFAGWTGAAEGETANPLTVTMDGNKTIGAIFKSVNLASNGSFEEGIGGIDKAPGYVDTNFTFPTGWQKESWGVIGYRGSDADGTGDGDVMANTVAVKDGRYCMLLKSGASVSFTNAVVSRSGRYKLSAYALNRKGYSGGKYDGFVDKYPVFSASVNSSAEWSLLSGEVVLGPGVYTLSFKNTGGCQCMIDAISLTLEEELPVEIVVDTEHVNQTFNYQNVGVERTINVKVEVPNAGYTIKYSTTEEGEYTTEPIKYWQAGEYTIYYKVEAEGMEPATGFGTVTIGENWMPNGSFEDGTWIKNNNYGVLDNDTIAGTEVWVNTKDSGSQNGDICRAYDGSPFLGNVPAADGSYAYIVTRDNQISAPINLARSGKYQFSCKTLRRTTTYDWVNDQTAVVKIDDQTIATVGPVTSDSEWKDFSSEKFQLKKGEHTITIEGTTSQDSTILLDALRLDFKGGSGLVVVIE